MLATSLLPLLVSCGRPPAPDECVLYVACLEDSREESFPHASATYGPEGSCWSEPTGARDACRQHCIERLPVACSADTGGGGPDTSDGPGPDTGDAERSIDLTWSAEGVTIELAGMDTSGFDLGIAETIDRSYGWFGEDCLHGTASYQECHIVWGLGGFLTSIYDEVVAGTKTVDDVRSGETTLFERSFDDGYRLTYALTIDGGDCWVWGQDPSYYLDDPSFDSCDRLP
jgi:hypothetical protein